MPTAGWINAPIKETTATDRVIHSKFMMPGVAKSLTLSAARGDILFVQTFFNAYEGERNVKSLPRIGRTRTMAFIAALFLTGGGSAFAQNYQSYGECQSDLEQTEREARKWKTAWMDCAANRSNGSVQDCKGMETLQRIRLQDQLAQKRDTLVSRVRFLAPICSNWPKVKRSSTARGKANNRLNKHQRQRQIQLTQEQFAARCPAEERKQQELIQRLRNFEQWQQQRNANAAAATARNQAEAQAVGNLAGGSECSAGIVNPKTPKRPRTRTSPSTSPRSAWSKKGRDKVQSTRAAWSIKFRTRRGKPSRRPIETRFATRTNYYY